MRTIITETKVYKFDELTEEQKNKVIEKLYDINVNYDWWEDDGLLDVEQNKWIKYGLKNCLFKWDKIYFDIDRNSHLEFINLTVTNNEVLRQALKISKRLWNKVDYYFTNTQTRNADSILDFHMDYNVTEKEQKTLKNATEIFAGWREEALNNLRKNYDYLTSREAIIETIEANEYEFDENGNLA